MDPRRQRHRRGRRAAVQLLAAAATGSYAAWVDGDEAVVYDTASGTEVLHAPVPGEGPGSVIAVDGNHAYVSNGTRVDDWNIDQETKTSFTRPGAYDEILYAANGYLAWDSGVVSRDPEATGPVFGRYAGMDETHLSPSGAYVAGAIWIYDRAEHENITPDRGRLRMEVIVQWLDNDRYVADTDNSLTSANPEEHSLLICSASARTCDVAVELTDLVVYPNGLSHEGG